MADSVADRYGPLANTEVRIGPVDFAPAATKVRSSLAIAAVPGAASLTSLRQRLTGMGPWHRTASGSRSSRYALPLYEALANVVQHAYRPDRTGVLDLNAVCTPAQALLMVTVTDHGRWRPRLLDIHSPHGHELQLTRGLTPLLTIHPDLTTAPTTPDHQQPVDTAS